MPLSSCSIDSTLLVGDLARTQSPSPLAAVGCQVSACVCLAMSVRARARVLEHVGRTPIIVEPHDEDLSANFTSVRKLIAATAETGDI